MAKGTGVGLSIDPSLDHQRPTRPLGFVFFRHNHQHQQPDRLPKWTFPDSMDGDLSGSLDRIPPSAVKFPFNLSASNDRDDDRDRTPSPCDGKRAVIDEMDFFALKNDSDTRDDVEARKDRMNGPTRLELMNVNTGLNLLTRNTSSDQSTVDDGISPNTEEKRVKSEMVVLQAEIERMGNENQRLRDMLSRVTTDYHALQTHLIVLTQEQKPGNPKDVPESSSTRRVSDRRVENRRSVVPRQFMDLSLATLENEAEDHSSSEGKSRDGSGSPVREGEEKSPDKVWLPNNMSASPSKSGMDHQMEATMRKARVSVRARSEATMITDGCQWRKYGQKMAKGNPCPRAYYRCTMAAGCPVRKQVQRCAEDRSVLITTYEGNHNHPLPPAAMTMVSTTSSAAKMLLSGSTSTSDRITNANFLTRTVLPCSSSVATISASAPFPTVTLDLTQNPNNLQSQPPPPGHFPVPFPPSGPNFGHNPDVAAMLPQLFGQAMYNQSKFSGLEMSQDMKGSSQLDVATAAIAANPNFTAALAAAISSIIGSPGSGTANLLLPNSCETTTNSSSKDGNGKIGNNSS